MGMATIRTRRQVKRLGSRVQQRSITVDLTLDELVADRVDAEMTTYSAVVDEALRVLFGKDKQPAGKVERSA